MSGDVQETIFEDAFDTTQYVFDLKFFDLGDVKLLKHCVIVIFLDVVHFILVPFGGFLLHRLLLLYRGLAACRPFSHVGLADFSLLDCLLHDLINSNIMESYKYHSAGMLFIFLRRVGCFFGDLSIDLTSLSRALYLVVDSASSLEMSVCASLRSASTSLSLANS